MHALCRSAGAFIPAASVPALLGAFRADTVDRGVLLPFVLDPVAVCARCPAAVPRFVAAAAVFLRAARATLVSAPLRGLCVSPGAGRGPAPSASVSAASPALGRCQWVAWYAGYGVIAD
jgi:hypothetical protein